MKPSDKSEKIDHRFTRQLLAILFFIALPIIMILYNGQYALRGILWDVRENTEIHLDPPVFVQETEKNTSIDFGVYDPEAHFKGDSTFRFEQKYISWVDYDHKVTLDELRSIRSAGMVPILTIEPWSKKGAAEGLMEDILAGQYDTTLSELSSMINASGGPIYVSWGHEMDQDLTTRYHWSGSDPEAFVKAYRYVVDQLNATVEEDIHWIWAPVVKKGCKRYYPGDDYVDYVGMPIYSFPDWDLQYYGYIRDFETTFREKYRLIQSLNKPLFITELGVAGSFDFQSFWLRDAFVQMQKVPELSGVIIFYAGDTPGAWGESVGTPDWRSHPELVTGLIDWVTK